MTRKTELFPKNSVVVPRGHPRIVVRNDANFLHGCRGTSARADTDSAQADSDFPRGGCGSSVRIRVKNGRSQKVNFVCNSRLKDREARRKDRSNYHYRNRSRHEICTESSKCPRKIC